MFRRKYGSNLVKKHKNRILKILLLTLIISLCFTIVEVIKLSYRYREQDQLKREKEKIMFDLREHGKTNHK